LAPNRANTIVFAGFQAPGTRGATIVAGAAQVKIHGTDVPVRAEVRNLGMLSAHADRNEILAWLGGFESPPRLTFVTHGEPIAAAALSDDIEARLGWRCRVPALGDSIELVPA